ncbi:MAG: hypothetical protein ABIP78_06670 [Pyrinomonadaceae bacterium]
MKDLIEKFQDLELEISKVKGDFALFALFLRDDSVDKWDIVVAAPWIENDRKNALAYITSRIQLVFSKAELTRISRVILIDEANPALSAVNTAIRMNHGAAEVKDSNFFGLRIKHGYILTSQRPNAIPETSMA